MYTAAPNQGHAGWTWYTGAIRVDLSGRNRVDSWYPPPRQQAVHRPANSKQLAWLHSNIPIWKNILYDSIGK